MLALVDCENFYVSCERVFDQTLRRRPVVVLSNNDGCVISALRRVPVGDVWGIGPRRTRLLRDAGIETAYGLARADRVWVRRQMGVTGLRAVYELCGTPCLPLEDCPRPRKSVVVSRSFGRAVESLSELREAVAHYVSKAAVKLRRERLAACVLVVFLDTNRFANEPQYSPSTTLHLPLPTNLTTELIRHAQCGLERIYRDNYRYKKAGVMLFALVAESPARAGLYDMLDRARAARVVRAVDEINRRMGDGTVRYLGGGLRQSWAGRCERRSPRYTTRWDELLTLSAP